MIQYLAIIPVLIYCIIRTYLTIKDSREQDRKLMQYKMSFRYQVITQLKNVKPEDLNAKLKKLAKAYDISVAQVLAVYDD